MFPRDILKIYVKPKQEKTIATIWFAPCASSWIRGKCTQFCKSEAEEIAAIMVIKAIAVGSHQMCKQLRSDIYNLDRNVYETVTLTLY